MLEDMMMVIAFKNYKLLVLDGTWRYPLDCYAIQINSWMNFWHVWHFKYFFNTCSLLKIMQRSTRLPMQACGI